MIVRIMGEGQFVVDDEVLDTLNSLDDDISDAVEAGDADALRRVLDAMSEQVRTHGAPVDDDLLIDSDVILPPVDSTVDEIRELIGDEGLIPG